MNKQMKEIRKRVQATLNEEKGRLKQVADNPELGPWDYDVDAWIECLEGVLWQIDWVQEHIKDEEGEE